jgi:hypothetical protein
VERPISIREFIRKIERLPSDDPVHDPKVWYTTQKEHWLGWLRKYDAPGAYGRIAGTQRDARFAYNHIVEPKMLLWLIEAAGVSKYLVEAAQRASAEGASLMQKSGVIRKVVPWAVLSAAIWGDDG